MTATRFYVRRVCASTGEEAWVGPIRSEIQAGKEKDAWEKCGREAEVLPTSTEVRRRVRAWEARVQERRRKAGEVV